MITDSTSDMLTKNAYVNGKFHYSNKPTRTDFQLASGLVVQQKDYNEKIKYMGTSENGLRCTNLRISFMKTKRTHPTRFY